MHIPKRIIHLAKDRALSGFSALSEQTVVDADSVATRAMNSASPAELRDLNIVRTFLRGEARTLRARMDRHFAGFLDRAMLTMHRDLRGEHGAIDYDKLTLIDDDVVVRQIEVDRMVGRLRDAEPVALGRVNVTIAMLHNDSDARERENPFRPYLLARSLYEALRELMWEEAQSKLLFDALGQAMARRLPGFYAGIVDVFEAGGITARLAARPTAMSRSERERLAWQRAAQSLLGSVDPGQLAHSHVDAQMQQRLIPKLQRLREISLGDASMGARQPDVLELVWNTFHRPKGTPSRPQARPGSGVRPALDAALLALQQAVAAGGAPPAPLELRDVLGDAPADPEQRRTMDVAALLFEAMVDDELLRPPARRQVARLYLPFVRAALMQPELMHDAQHPARRLLDRIGSVGAGITTDMARHALIDAELEGIAGAVLDLFDDDMAIFADAERALDSEVSAQLAAGDARIAPAMEAVGEAAVASARLAGASQALSAALQPLRIDPRVADFILGTWARVLSHPASKLDAAIALLPELLWSAQEKTTPADRSSLMRMLPELVRRVREGMAGIALPDGPSKAAFDRLVAVHMDVLGNRQEPALSRKTLEQFCEHFRNFSIDSGDCAPSQEGWIGRFELESALALRGAGVALNAKQAGRLPHASDADWLSWARPGTAFEVQVEGRYRPALLCAATTGGSAFLLSIAGEAQPALYLRAPLVEALETSVLRPIEHAPLFDRAVESLMAGAESLSG